MEILLSNSNPANACIAKQPPTTLNTRPSRRQMINAVRQWEAGVPSKNKTLKRQKTDFEEINFKLFEWFSEARSKNLPCGFGIGENIDTDVQLIEADPTITSLLGSVTWENFVTMDNNDDSIHSPQSSENHEQFEVQDDEEEEEAPVQEVSTKMALQCVRKLISYSIHMGNRELLQFSENIENILEIEFISKKILMLSLEERTVKRRGQFGHSPMVSSLEDFYCTMKNKPIK
ncbi:hypothetical protein HELRODRAFT_173598 [Helobdella robusta]|uniref:Uncharacterized protein n=1 Tax=Helobdella robusta TaxID=6412 RepID=T1F704_HELRO|nr:hypothetical protein HELRODRAFT_173598 [Helobdella robusta]ESO03312.1 hypothetical protein HELRODRAFT_173598 [Helobdella robusta]